LTSFTRAIDQLMTTGDEPLFEEFYQLAGNSCRGFDITVLNMSSNASSLITHAALLQQQQQQQLATTHEMTSSY
jgi:hypothetical protein